MRAEGEVAIQCEAQDFRGSVLRDHLVTSMSEDELGIRTKVNRFTIDFWGAMISCFPFAHLNRAVGSWLPKLSQPPRCWDLYKRQQRLVISVRCHVSVKDGTMRHKAVKEGWTDNGSLWEPCPHLA